MDNHDLDQAIRANHEIDQAAAVLRRGGLVAFPTETVYGLGADARNAETLNKIFTAKGRPADHPLIVHVQDLEQARAWVAEMPDMALELAAQFWPGPLTLILQKAPHVSPLITGNQATIAIRMPSHPRAQALLRAFGGALAAPSANRFGRISPTTADAVREELGNAVDMVLDGGQCDVGLESTIVDARGEHPLILRPGHIGAQQIENVLGLTTKCPPEKIVPRVSGAMESHYAPETPLVLVAGEDALTTMSNESIVFLSHEKFSRSDTTIEFISMPANPQDYAHELYATLRLLDKKHFQCIVIQTVPEGDAWDAIRDRLQRASSKK
jgi:L-threonylcarbamoyladenylate synthase